MILNSRRQIVLSIIGIINLIVYCVARIGFFLMSSLNLLELIYTVIFLIAEFFLLLQGLGLFLTIWRVAKNDLRKKKDPPVREVFSTGNYPSVAVVVVARHEPHQVLENTFTMLKNLNYPRMNIYFLDDSSEEQFQKEAEEIAAKFSVRLYRRPERHGAKAGIINDFLKTAKEKYIALFDADQNPMPDFLMETVPILENRKNVAFVQTPQFYTNLDTGPVPRAAGMQQAIFYEIVCEGKGLHNSMFCCGTNVVFRTAALEKVGGFDENSITEDFATSIDLHNQGYDSVYYDHAAVFGMGPESLTAYFKQQMRWATGTTACIKKLLKILFKGPRGFNFVQSWEYFLSSTYYFVGWAFFITMMSPILNLIFQISPFVGNSLVYLGTFMPFFFISLFLFFLSMKNRNYKFSQLSRGIILTYLNIPIFMLSVIYGLFTKKKKYEITAKGKYESLPFKMLLPYLFMIALSVVALANSVLIFYYEKNYALIINMFWVAYHLVIISNIFYFNRRFKKQAIRG